MFVNLDRQFTLPAGSVGDKVPPDALVLHLRVDKEAPDMVAHQTDKAKNVLGILSDPIFCSGKILIPHPRKLLLKHLLAQEGVSYPGGG
jgi:hypothetical protein